MSYLYQSEKVQCIPTLGIGGTVSSTRLCLNGNFSVLKLSRPIAAKFINRRLSRCKQLGGVCIFLFINNELGLNAIEGLAFIFD